MNSVLITIREFMDIRILLSPFCCRVGLRLDAATVLITAPLNFGDFLSPDELYENTAGDNNHPTEWK